MSYSVGTNFLSSGKHPRLCTIVDMHTTRNLAGDVVRTRYVATHELLGQTIADSDVNDTTVARGIARMNGELA